MYLIQNLYSVNIGILLLCLLSSLGLVVKNVDRKSNLFIICLAAAVIGAFVTAVFINSNIIPSVYQFVFLKKIYNSFILLVAVFVLLLISELTGYHPFRLRFFMLLPLTALFVFNLISPFSLYFDNISAVNRVSLLFSLHYNSPDAAISVFVPIISVICFFILIFIYYAVRFAFYNHRKRDALFVIFSFTPAVLLLIAANWIYQTSKGISGLGDLIFDFGLFYLVISIGAKNFKDVLNSGSIAKSLHDSETKYRLLFENMAEGFSLNEIITDVSGTPVDFRIIETNIAFQKQTGAKNLYLGITYRRLNPDASPDLFRNYNNIVLKGIPFKEEFYSALFNRFLRLTSFPHQKGRFATIYEDISEQKNAEQALRNSEKQFSDLMAVSPDIILMHKNGKVVYANQTACLRSEYSIDELLGANILDFISPAHHDSVIKNINKRNAGESVADYECDFILKSGMVRTDIVRSTVTTFNNEPVILTILFDITDRKLAENQLRESEQKFKALADSTAVAILAYQNDKFIYANPAAETISGYSLNEIIGMNFWHFTAPEFQLPLRERAGKRQAGEKLSPSFEFRIITKYCVEKWVSLAGSQILFAGKPAVLISVIDINSLKTAELEIKKRNLDLLRINAEKDKLFSIIAHDLKGPFHGLIGLSDILMDPSQHLPYDQVVAVSRNLNDSAQQLYKLLQNLLEWSSFQQGLIKFNPVKLNLASLIAGSIAPFDELALQKEITLLNHVPSSLNVFADEEMVNIVVRNLISNAIKFSFRGGNIRITAFQLDNQFIQILVCDNGIGMDISLINKLFHVGEKVSTPGTEGEPSSGLGLVLCKEFVEKHNGTIRVESVKNFGSTFYFTLPLNHHTN